MSQESIVDILAKLNDLRVLVEQLRDNSRFNNWAYFPGNSIEYVYAKDGTLREEILLRHNKIVLKRVYAYDNNGNMERITVG